MWMEGEPDVQQTRSMSSSVKLQRLHAAYARKRENEHIRHEKNAATNQYYQHWEKVTNRFDNWTRPEYYDQCSQQLQQTKEKKEKDKLLNERREKLRTKFDAERKNYELELHERRKPRSVRLKNTETALLGKVRENLKSRENLKRQLELESKLYGRWRHGVDDDGLLFESKSTHQALAKLNWLDKQIENQMEREKEEKTVQERNLRLQEEVRKTEEQLKERQKIREQEISEIRALQERHIDSLNQRQTEHETLKSEMTKLQSALDDIEKIESALKAKYERNENQLLASSSSTNFTKMKMTIRRRSQDVREDIGSDIDLLERIHSYANRPDIVRRLIGQFNGQLEQEERLVGQIEAMYESEAKHCLTRCEEVWRKSKEERQNEIRHLLQDEHRRISDLLDVNMQRQSDLIEVRSTHLASIENSNEKLKQLIREEEESPRSVHKLVAGASSSSLQSKRETSVPRLTDSFSHLNLDRWKDDNPLHNDEIGGSPRSQSSAVSQTPSVHKLVAAPSTMPSSSSLQSKREASVPRLTDSFSHLNLDRWKDDNPLHNDEIGGSPRGQFSQRSAVSQTPSSVDVIEKPRFGRKRVAWT